MKTTLAAALTATALATLLLATSVATFVHHVFAGLGAMR